MKKKIMMLVLCLSVGAFAVGCSNNDTESNSGSTASTAGTSSASSEEEIPIVDEDLPVSECVTLGDYKGITLDKEIQQVTDEDVENSISSNLMATVDDPEATVQEGDTVDIAFVGKVDGEEFEGGSSDSYNLTIGSNTFIDGFEDGVIGMKQDETKDLNLTFPEDYTEELAGKDVVFTVTVNAISRPQELTEAWVQENTDYTTIDEYRQAQREQLEASNEFSAENTLESTALQAVLNNAEIKQIPQSYITLGEQMNEQMYTSYASLYGVTLDEFLDQYVDKDAYEQEQDAYARQVAELSLVINAISEEEGWTTDDEDYISRFNTMVQNSGVTEEEFVEQNGEESIELSVNQDRVLDLVLENATINEVMVDAEGNPV